MNLHRTLPLIAALCATGVFAADKPAEPAKEAGKEAAKPVAADAIEYSDAKECHIKTADKPMPVIHALIASRGLTADKPMPVIHELIASRGLPDSNPDQLRIALGTAIANGCDLNEPDIAGLQPLNAAILFNDAEIVALLLEKGADPYQPIHKPGSQIDGVNSFDFLKKIEEKEKARQGEKPDRAAVATALQKYR